MKIKDFGESSDHKFIILLRSREHKVCLGLVIHQFGVSMSFLNYKTTILHTPAAFSWRLLRLQTGSKLKLPPMVKPDAIKQYKSAD